MKSRNYISDFIIWRALIVFACARSYTCVRVTTRWKSDVSLNKFVCPNEATFVTRESSIMACGRLCTVISDCMSFIYYPTSNLTDDNCYLNDHELSSLNGCQPMNDAQYFKEIKHLFSCHPDDGLYRTFHLSNGDIFTYRVVHTQLKASDAQSECKSSGGDLAKLSTISRLQLIYQLMTTCPGFGGDYMYYVDGNDLNIDGVYKWSNGGIIPMTSTFWRTGMPNGMYEHCLMIRGTQWLHDDLGCSVAKSFICERP